jgi:uncharacterized protein (TIGR02001 family)
MKKLILASAIIAAFAGNVAHAQDSVHEVSFNAAVVSDYRYRGISQTRLRSALQGGADYTHAPSGFYAGTWLSTIKWTKDSGGDGNVEVDVYAGKRGEFGNGLTYDFGGLGYIYPSNDLERVGLDDANTFELYGQLGFGPAYIKYSHSTTNLFGVPDSKNSGYLDIGANFDVGNGYTLNLHAGHQKVKNSPASDYTDWKVGVTKDFGIVTGSLAVIGTDITMPAPNGKNLGKTGVILSVSKTF